MCRALHVGFEKDIRSIVAGMMPAAQRQTMLFTATWQGCFLLFLLCALCRYGHLMTEVSVVIWAPDRSICVKTAT